MRVSLKFINLRIHIDYNTNVYTKLIRGYIKLGIGKGAMVELYSQTNRPNKTTTTLFEKCQRTKHLS